MELRFCSLVSFHNFFSPMNSCMCAKRFALFSFLFCIFNKRGYFQLLQRLCLVQKPPFDSPYVHLLISAGLHVSVAPPSIFIRGCASFSLTALSPFLPPTHPAGLLPPFLFSPGTGLICGLRVQRRIEGRETGENWKEGGNMKGRSWRV